ncbi:MAG: MBL fold metallo-hydrolase [Planctomycetota bacterium]|jgi:phosphoribosyl 1,2-cyclic phosphodiesterase
MLIRCWGARGSIPVSGAQYLRYGGDSTCTELRTGDGKVIVIDAGSGIRRLGKLLVAEGVSDIHLLFTHAHWDHLLGFPFFQPLYESGCSIRILGAPSAQSSIRQMISETMAPPNFPVPLEDVHAEVTFSEDCRDPFAIGTVGITPMPLSHPDHGLGYRFAEDGRTFVFLTDNELAFQHPGGARFDDYARFCQGADLLVHDAEFTPAEYAHTRTWGHSRFTDAVELATRADVAALGLFHHNADRTDDQVDEIVAACRRIIADNTARIECFAAAQDMERRL